ncbi:hypothetical protein C8J57DRAFT_1484130 [Mycena rebaudengoi]|nr:hypothetical protein C8J57DRAFT_1484130 [Mycena rebaudengoi]
MARVLFERSSQAKDVAHIDSKINEVSTNIVDEQKGKFAHLALLNAPTSDLAVRTQEGIAVKLYFGILQVMLGTKHFPLKSCKVQIREKVRSNLLESPSKKKRSPQGEVWNCGGRRSGMLENWMHQSPYALLQSMGVHENQARL